jgi:hypothetical protein
MWNRVFFGAEERSSEFESLDRPFERGRKMNLRVVPVTSSNEKNHVSPELLSQTHALMDTILKSMISSCGWKTTPDPVGHGTWECEMRNAQSRKKSSTSHLNSASKSNYVKKAVSIEPA